VENFGYMWKSMGVGTHIHVFVKVVKAVIHLFIPGLFTLVKVPTTTTT